ncbi:MAG: hypothetical protein N3B16_06315 [Candidatus Aminicenantes bacterium]|nr:hypothetical protein [Candidatus Aminicenantes bacterium]
MSSFPSLSFNLYLVWKKILRTRVFFFFGITFVLFLGFLWWLADFNQARRFFFFLFPYIFLLMSQDIFKDEIESGSLENVLFLSFNFRRYLFEKNFSLFLIGSSFSAILFFPFLLGSILKDIFTPLILSSFFMGLMVGLYYLSLAGWLGFRLRSGANILAIILGQVFLFLVLMVSLTSSSSARDLLDLIFSAQPKNNQQAIFLYIFIALWPNVLTTQAYSALNLRLEIILLITLFFGFQSWHLRRLELKRE